MNRRLDIYLNGDSGLVDLVRRLLRVSTTAPYLALALLCALLAPVMVLIAPIVAIFTAHRLRYDDDDI